MSTRYQHALGAVLLASVIGVAAGLAGDGTPGSTWRLEMEAAGAGCAWPSGQAWEVKPLQGASAGSVLAGSAADALGESNGIALRLPHAGTYRLWVRYYQSTRPGSFYLLVRDEDGEAVAFGKLDWHARLASERPYQTVSSRPEKPGWAWECVPAVFERPMTVSLSVGALIHGDGHARRQVDCVVVSGDSAFDPRAAAELADLPTPPATGVTDAPATAAASVHARAFAGVDELKHRFHLGLINNASMYVDYARIVRLGFNADHGAGRGAARYGVGTMAVIETFATGDKELAEAHPTPAGRFVNAEGQVGRGWSLSFEPLRAAAERELRRRIETYVDRPEVEDWRICAEVAGWMDYSAPSQRAFRAWLTTRYGTLEELNRIWATAHKSFDSVAPPRSVDENKAGWLDFREFCGQTFAEAVAAQMPVIAELDPKRRLCIGQNSNLDLLAAYFTAMRPMDWEQFIRVALADQPRVGWDTYCADDYMGCEVDLLQSLAGERGLINEEWNVHATDWRIAARTFWTMVGKGVKGIYCFQFQEGTYHDSYPKWALLRHDLTPKQKLGAFADGAHEVHRLERFLTQARRHDAVKPVALYYSRIDLSLDQPLASTWGEGIDSPYRVYEILRGLGYSVRWITPRQIEEGQLASVAAVVLVNAQHIPKAAASTLAAWVHDGGAVLGDLWPGAFDEHGRAQDALAPVFGIRAAEAVKSKQPQGKLALEESIQGYGEITISAIEPDERHKTVGEMWQQWDATHPVARELGPYLLSGFGLQRVQCVDGQVIGMTFGGRPGVVLNEFGEGHALYVAMLLGSLYSSSATRFEWDTTHSGLDAHRLLHAFLKHAGVQTAAEPELPPRLRAKLRVEAPLVDQAGNVLIGVTSFNDEPLKPFPLTLRWSEQLGKPVRAFAAVGGSRRLSRCSFDLDGDSVRLTLPALDTHATVLLLTDSGPLVSLQVRGAPRAVAGLLHVNPGTELRLEATVHNPSPTPLPAGSVELLLPRGWRAPGVKRAVRPLKPWAERAVVFHVTAPSVCAARRLRPLLVRYRTSRVESTPATELVWWEPKHEATR